MTMTKYTLNRLSSIVYRKSQQYFDKELSIYHIGWGQQFFLLRIYENNGISLIELAMLGHFDKGTTVKAVQKLEELGYIYRKVDPLDRRVHRAYTTEKAREVVEAIYSSRKKWNEILTSSMTPEEGELAETLLEKMAICAYEYMNEKEMCTNAADKSAKSK